MFKGLVVVILCLAACATTQKAIELDTQKTVEPRIGCTAMGMVFCIRFDECRMINEGAKDLGIAKLSDSCKHGNIPEEFNHPLDATKLNTCLQKLGRMPCGQLSALFGDENSEFAPPECSTM